MRYFLTVPTPTGADKNVAGISLFKLSYSFPLPSLPHSSSSSLDISDITDINFQFFPSIQVSYVLSLGSSTLSLSLRKLAMPCR